MEPSKKPLSTYLAEFAREVPEKKMIGDSNGWLTAGEVLARAEAVAYRLQGLGVREGSLIALRAERTTETILTIFALQIIGAITVLADPHCEVEPFLGRCAPPVLVDYILEGRGNKLLLRVPGASTEQSLPNLFAPGLRLSAPPDRDARAPSFIIFTSGSTGQSKAVMLSQYNLVNNLLDSQPLGYYKKNDIALGALPLDHVFGLVLLAGTPVLRYALYLPETTDIPTILDSIEAHGITRMNGVPSLYLAMAAQRGKRRLSSLRAGFIGGGPCTVEQFHRIEQELDMTLIPVYGMSECIGISCASYRDSQQSRASGVGTFYSMNTGRILLADGTQAPPGVEGEICVDGPARMVGYYGDNDLRAPLLYTGDLGYVDGDGILHLTGRKKDVIIRHGFNLSPLRIEEALLSLPGVMAAAVVGLPNEDSGELPWAMVVCREGAPNDLTQALCPLLAKNELPAGILQADVLPMTPSGKPDKQKIREVLALWKA